MLMFLTTLQTQRHEFPGCRQANLSLSRHRVTTFFLVMFFAIVAKTFCATSLSAETNERPNIILIFTDDQGYNDLGCFGSKRIKTPNIDRLATEGRKYTSFYVPSSVCSPSRAALLTGCYPKRVGMHKHVLFPRSDHGLNPKEHTIAD